MTTKDAVVRAGLVDDSLLAEFRRWGYPLDATPDPEVMKSADNVLACLRAELESNEHFRIDETDLDLMRLFLHGERHNGKLVIRRDGKQRTLKVEFCRTALGDIAIPWTDEDEPDFLVNGESHLKCHIDGRPVDFYFTDMRQVFFGKKKAFVVCSPSKEDTDV